MESKTLPGDGRHWTFAIDGRYVDPASLTIRSQFGETQVELKVMSLLVALSERPGRLWPRVDLLDRLWPNGEGSDESLTRAVYILRKSLCDAHGLADAIVTVPKLGYRLDAKVNHNTAGLPEAVGEVLAWQRDAAGRGLSVAVAPIRDTSADGGNSYLADGLTRDLTRFLSRSPRLRVAPYSSVTHYSDLEAPAERIGEALDVHFLVTGTLARRADDIRLRIEMVDCRSDSVVWSQRYDTGLDGFLEVQEDVVLSISTAISTKVKLSHAELLALGETFNASAYELVQAAESLRSNYGREAAGEIVRNLRAALEIEPHNAVARGALAVQLSQNVVSQWTDDPAATRKEADRLVEGALAAAPNDPEVLAAAGVVAGMLHRPDEAIRHLERSIQRDPNNAHALAMMGWQMCLRRNDPYGIDLIELAEARAPHHPRFGLWAMYRGTGHLFMLDYEAGALACRQAVARTPNYYQPYLSLAWALTGLGEREAAAESAARAQALDGRDIAAKFVRETTMWAANSPNAQACADMLGEMALLAK